MTTRMQWIEDRDGWMELRDEWDVLADRARDPFSRHDWLSAWWECFPPTGPMAICTVRDDAGRLVAALPAWRDGRRLCGVNDTEVWLGSRPLATGPEAMELLVAALSEHDALHLAIPGVPIEDPFAAAFLRAADRWGVCRRLTPYRSSPIVDTTGAYADWRAETRPRWRTDIERMRRKMERDHDAEIVILARPDDLDAQLEACWDVERRGWKGEEGTAIAASAATTDFYRRVAHAFADRDELRLSWIKLDGELVAFDYLLVSYRRLWGLKTGFDPAHRRLAPGFILRLALIERCFEEPIDALELLGDADEWKMRFATEVRDHRVLETCPRRSSTALSWAARDRFRPLARAARSERIKGRLPQRVLDMARAR